MFWVFFIIGWILVHGATRGRYLMEGFRSVKTDAAGIILAVSLIGALIGASGNLGIPASAFLAGFTWFGILLLRSSMVQKALADEVRESLRDSRPVPKVVARTFTPPRKESHARYEGGAKPESGGRPAGQTAGEAKAQKTAARLYKGDLEQAMSVARDVLQIRQEREESPKQAAPDPATPLSNELQPVLDPLADPLLDLPDESLPAGLQEVPQDSADAWEEQQPQPSRIAAAQPDSAQDDGGAVETDLRSWHPPGFDRRAEMVESSTPQQRPDSMFASRGSTSLGTGVSSLFDGSSQADVPRQAIEAVDEVIASNRLQVDADLVKPEKLLEQVEDEAEGSGFHYKPTDGIKSRF